jgi:hypothetical protein
MGISAHPGFFLPKVHSVDKCSYRERHGNEGYQEGNVSVRDRRKCGAAWRQAAVATTLALGLSSCAAAGASDDTSNITLEEAKTKVLSLQHEIVQRVPEDLVISVFESNSSSLLSCGVDRKKWSGTGQVELRPGLDRNEFLDEVRESLSGQDGWTASDDTDKDGDRVVDLLHDDGTHLIVGIWDGPESLQVDSFSACFDFPEYEYGEKY